MLCGFLSGFGMRPKKKMMKGEQKLSVRRKSAIEKNEFFMVEL